MYLCLYLRVILCLYLGAYLCLYYRLDFCLYFRKYLRLYLCLYLYLGNLACHILVGTVAKPCAWTRPLKCCKCTWWQFPVVSEKLVEWLRSRDEQSKQTPKWTKDYNEAEATDFNGLKVLLLHVCSRVFPDLTWRQEDIARISSYTGCMRMHLLSLGNWTCENFHSSSAGWLIDIKGERE